MSEMKRWITILLAAALGLSLLAFLLLIRPMDSLRDSAWGLRQAVSPGLWWTVQWTTNWFSVPFCTL